MKNTVCISIKELYGTYGSRLSCCRIEHKTEEQTSEKKDYYDLYNGPYLICMDGERCMVLREKI